MDMDNIQLLQSDLMIASTYIIWYLLKLKLNKRRCYSAKKILLQRPTHGYYKNLIAEMRLTDTDAFRNFHRMTPEMFDKLLSLYGPPIQKQEAFAINPITPDERLSLTLRYLASGDSMVSIRRYGTSAVIWDKLKQSFFPNLSTESWEQIASEYNTKLHFPNCLGAIDGKHVVVQEFPNSNSSCYNYKNSHSIVLMAVSDADYKFVFVDIGSSGRNNDSGIFRRSSFGERIIAI